MTAAEFLALGPTQERLELVDGVVVMSPRPTPLHQTILRLVLKQIDAWIDEHPGAACFPEVDWELRPHNVYQPDIVCYAPGRLQGIPTHLAETPDLIIEILSPSTKSFDLTTKKDDYEQHGIAEYWAIDPRDARVRCYRREGAKLIEVASAGGADQGNTVESSSLPGFVFDLLPLREAVASAAVAAPRLW
jgi:Uma2 family endonuclease